MSNRYEAPQDITAPATSTNDVDHGESRAGTELVGLILPSVLPLNGLTFENSYRTNRKFTLEALQARMDLADYMHSVVSVAEMPEVESARFIGRMVTRVLRAARPSEQVSPEVLEVIEGERAICHGTARLGPLTDEEVADCFGGQKTGRAVAIFFRNHAVLARDDEWNWLTSTD